MVRHSTKPSAIPRNGEAMRYASDRALLGKFPVVVLEYGESFPALPTAAVVNSIVCSTTVVRARDRLRSVRRNDCHKGLLLPIEFLPDAHVQKFFMAASNKLVS